MTVGRVRLHGVAALQRMNDVDMAHGAGPESLSSLVSPRVLITTAMMLPGAAPAPIKEARGIAAALDHCRSPVWRRRAKQSVATDAVQIVFGDFGDSPIGVLDG